MHMTLWWGCTLGDFMFKGVAVNTVVSLSVTCLVMCALAVAFEGAKWVLAIMQKASNRQMPNRSSDERRNLLQRGNGEAGPSHSQVPVPPATPSMTKRCAYHIRQALLYLVHNLTSFILMMAVMLYNGYMIIAVTLGLTLGYFLFGPRMISLQMECDKWGVTCQSPICSPECDDNAETSTPPLLHMSIDSSDPSSRFTCESRACLLPKNRHDSDETLSQEDSPPNCHYGARECPARIAAAKRNSKQKESRVANEKCHTESVAIEVASCSSRVIESSLPEVDSQLLQIRPKNNKSCCGKSNNSSAAEEFDTTLTVGADDSKQIDSCCSREKKTSDSLNAEVMPNVKDAVNVESECEKL